MGFPINAAGVQHSALLQRQMRFTTIAAIETAAQFASVLVGIVLALNGWAYWALVAMALAIPGTSTVCFWLATGWIPGGPARGSNVSGMLKFGSTITLNNMIMYVAYNVDKALLGRFWGAEALGVYGRACQLVSIPTDSMGYSAGGIAIAALSRLQGDRDRFRSYFLRAYSLVVAFTVPVTIACALFADDILVVLLGSKWQDAVPIFRIMAPTILSLALINPLSWLLVSSGRIRRSLNMALVIAPLVVVAYSAGVPYGPRGVALGYSSMMTALTVPLILWATHGLPVTAKDILRAVAPPFVSSLVATAVSLLVAYAVAGSLPPLLRLLVEGSVLVASYIGMLLFGMRQKDAYVDLVRALRAGSSARPRVQVEGAAI
jgi:O-antigen/teichoic acid export membrane protein